MGPSSQPPEAYHRNGERRQREREAGGGVGDVFRANDSLPTVFTSSLISSRAINHRARAESCRGPLWWLRLGLGHHKIHIKSEMGVLTPHSFPQCTSSASGYTAPSERLALLGVDVGFGLRPPRAASRCVSKSV